ncbi:hypothetical protein [Lelliottia wanjuensis]|nr:hypothetical protein [Lelliottia sp. V106_16]MDK9356708.1 hypothetical protein [Lelliottia sp. V106_16]
MNQQEAERLTQALTRSRDDHTRRRQRRQGERMTERDRDIKEAMKNRP